MNVNANGNRRVRRRIGPRRLAAGLLTALFAGIALLTAACGGSPAAGPTASSAQTSVQAMNAYAACMRAHGTQVFAAPMNRVSMPPPQDVPLYGGWTLEGGDPSSTGYQTATKACRRLFPTGGPPDAGELRQQLSDALKGAACMRAHGYPGFPDPTVQDGDVYFEPLPTSIDTSSPLYQAALKACRGARRP
jgi:hypothetical protein